MSRPKRRTRRGTGVAMICTRPDGRGCGILRGRRHRHDRCARSRAERASGNLRVRRTRAVQIDAQRAATQNHDRLLDTGISPLLTRREFLTEHPALFRVLLIKTAGVTRAILDLPHASPYAVSGSGTTQIVVEIKTASHVTAAPA